MSLETPNAFADEENILLHTALFKQVSPAEAEELLPHLKHATFDKGDYIFSEGDTDQRMYLLEQGRVKLIRTSSDDRVQLLSIHAPGEVLGEIPVFDPHGGPRTASAVSMSHGTRVVWLEHDALFAWHQSDPYVKLSLTGGNPDLRRQPPARQQRTHLRLGIHGCAGASGQDIAQLGLTFRRAGGTGPQSAA